MIYEFDDGFREITMDAIRSDRLTVALLSVEALKASYQTLGISEQNLNEFVMDSINFRSNVEACEDYYFGTLNLIDIDDVYGPRDKLGFLIHRNLFLVINIQDMDNSTSDSFQYALQRIHPEKACLGKIIYGFLERLLYADNQKINKKGLGIEELEEDIHKGDINQKFIGKILSLKKEVILLRNSYEQLVDVCEILEENENGIFSETETSCFQTLITRVERLSSQCLILKENLVQMREAYSASLDYSINTVMKLFTVVTTIFQPLTLITGWYGMNFANMPELTWRYGYVAVILLSLGVVLSCWWLFKKKRLL